MTFIGDGSVDIKERAKLYSNMFNYDYSDAEVAHKRRLTNLVSSIKMGLKLHNLSSNEMMLLHDEFGEDWREQLGMDDSRVQNIMEDIRDGLLMKDLTADEVQTLKEKYGTRWRVVVGYERSTDSDVSASPTTHTKYMSYAQCLKDGHK